MVFFKNLIGNTFKKRLMKELDNDEELKVLIQEGDKLVNNLKKSVISGMLNGHRIPSHLRRYTKNFSEKEKNYVTIKVLESVYNGVCPNDEIIELSNFNESHPMWSQYIILKEKRLVEDKKLEERVKRREKDKKREEKKEIQRLIKTYGKDIYERSVKGEIFKDMNVELRKISKGEPQKKEENLIRGKITEVWYYGEYENRLKNKSYKFSVRIIENVVVGWKNL